MYHLCLSQYWDTTTKTCAQKKSYNAACVFSTNPVLDQCDTDLSCSISKCKKTAGSNCTSNDECSSFSCLAGKCMSLINDTVILSSDNQMKLVNLIGRPDKIFRLCYRASRDGWRGQDFHDHCNYIPNTLTVIRATTGSIFGGFINGRWDSRSLYISDPYSYIYTLTNPSNSSAVMKMKNADGANAFHTPDSYGETF